MELKATTGESDEGVIAIYLKRAADRLCRMLNWQEVPPDYDHLQVEAAEYMLNKRGAEGETVHKENGIDRTYESADIPTSLLLSYGIVGVTEVVS